MIENKEAVDFINNVNIAVGAMHKTIFLTRFINSGFEPRAFKNLCSAMDVLWK